MVTASSIYEASERDYRLVAASDGTAGIYDRVERELAEIGVTLLPAAEIAEARDNTFRRYVSLQ